MSYCLLWTFHLSSLCQPGPCSQPAGACPGCSPPRAVGLGIAVIDAFLEMVLSSLTYGTCINDPYDFKDCTYGTESPMPELIHGNTMIPSTDRSELLAAGDQGRLSPS